MAATAPRANLAIVPHLVDGAYHMCEVTTSSVTAGSQVRLGLGLKLVLVLGLGSGLRIALG